MGCMPRAATKSEELLLGIRVFLYSRAPSHTSIPLVTRNTPAGLQYAALGILPSIKIFLLNEYQYS